MFSSIDTGRPSSSKEGLEAQFQKNLPFHMFYIYIYKTKTTSFWDKSHTSSEVGLFDFVFVLHCLCNHCSGHGLLDHANAEAEEALQTNSLDRGDNYKMNQLQLV